MKFIFVIVPEDGSSFDTLRASWSVIDGVFTPFITDDLAACAFPFALKRYLPKYLRDQVTDEEVCTLFKQIPGGYQDGAHVIEFLGTDCTKADMDYIKSLSDSLDCRMV